MVADLLAEHPVATTLLGLGGAVIVAVVCGYWLYTWWQRRDR